MIKEETTKSQEKKIEISEDFKEEFQNLDYLTSNCPFFLCMIDRLGFQVKNLCKNYKSKEEAKSLVKEIEKSPEKYKIKSKWEKYSLGDLFTADYNFLVENNIINVNLVPNEYFFSNRFYFMNIPEMIYPLTTKEYYFFFLKKEIEILINLYFDD